MTMATERKPIPIRFDCDERDWLDEYARRTTRSISNAVRAIVREAMERDRTPPATEPGS